MNEEIVNNQKEQDKKKGNSFKKVLFVFFLFLILFYVYIRFGEPNQFVTHEYAIVDNNLPYSFHGLKIVHFSDILYGTNQNTKSLEKVVKQINNLKPDIVIFTGDLFNNRIQLNEESKHSIEGTLKKINATYKKYAVIGDNDYIDKNSYIEIMENANFLVLNNKNDFLYYGGNDPLEFIGTNSILQNECDVMAANTSNESIQNVYKIWISHEPTIIEELQSYEIKPNLILAGHTLNGLMKFPWGDSLLNQNGIKEYTENYYNIEDGKMYISSGLGTYKYPVRFLNPPSINLYRLYQY